MAIFNPITVKDSIGFKLLRLVFSIYVIVAIVVTIAHMRFEYLNVKNNIESDFKLYQRTFENSLAGALWDLDEEQLHTILPGVVILPSIVGIKIEDLEDNVVASMGTIQHLPSHLNLESGASGLGELEDDRSGKFGASSLFWHSFPIIYQREGEYAEVGRGTFYSSRAVVLENVKLGFAFIIINAIIKTIALWLIFLVVVKRVLVKPLNILTNGVRSLKLDVLEGFNLDLEMTGKHELKILERAFNDMVSNLNDSRAELNHIFDDLDEARARLELLLEGTKLMPSYREPFSVMLSAANFMLKGINTDSIELVRFYHREEQSGVEVTYASYSLPILRLSSGASVLVNDKEWLSERVYSDDENSRIYSALQVHKGVCCRVSQDIVSIPLWYQNKLQGLVEIVYQKPLLFSKEESEYVETLALSLALALEELEFKKGLENVINLRTRELKELNHQLRTHSEDLAHKNIVIEDKVNELALAGKYKTDFLANMSHELRTPLSGMMILSQRLASNKDKNLTEKQVDFAKTIHKGGQTLLDLVNDILDLSKVEAGKLDVDFHRLPLIEEITQLEALFTPLANDKDIRFRCEIDGNVPHEINTDGRRLAQILRNFLSNAFKFTVGGEVVLRVSVIEGDATQSESNKQIAFSVKDSGIGIPTAKLEAIFESFQQGDGSVSRRYGGTGLGLTISRALAGLLKGKITLNSQEHVGSTFTLFLPFD